MAMLQAGHESRLEETIPCEAYHSLVVPLDTEVVVLRQEFLASRETRRVACSGILLVVLQDAPQHARRVTTTLRELHVEAQHVVEEHSVDDNMDEEEACGKDVEMDEVEDTYKGEAPLVRPEQ